MYRRIRDLREDKDLSQKKVASMLGMSQTGYSKYETGENDLPTSILIKLADFYDVSIDYLLNRTDNPTLNKQKKHSILVECFIFYSTTFLRVNF